MVRCASLDRNDLPLILRRREVYIQGDLLRRRFIQQSYSAERKRGEYVGDVLQSQAAGFQIRRKARN